MNSKPEFTNIYLDGLAIPGVTLRDGDTLKASVRITEHEDGSVAKELSSIEVDTLANTQE